jgi:hypothetical protein
LRVETLRFFLHADLLNSRLSTLDYMGHGFVAVSDESGE